MDISEGKDRQPRFKKDKRILYKIDLKQNIQNTDQQKGYTRFGHIKSIKDKIIWIKIEKIWTRIQQEQTYAQRVHTHDTQDFGILQYEGLRLKRFIPEYIKKEQTYAQRVHQCTSLFTANKQSR